MSQESATHLNGGGDSNGSGASQMDASLTPSVKLDPIDDNQLSGESHEALDRNETSPAIIKKEEETTDSEKRQKLLQLLSHRKLLLDRLTKCRKAAETRLEVVQNGDNETDNKSLVANRVYMNVRGKNESLDKESKKEVQDFQNLCKYALQFSSNNKRPEKSNITSTPRGSISLRKGASVGKKMQAAVATLTNNQGWISDSSASSLQQQQQNKYASAPISTAVPVSNSQVVISSSMTSQSNIAIPLALSTSNALSPEPSVNMSTHPVGNISSSGTNGLAATNTDQSKLGNVTKVGSVTSSITGTTSIGKQLKTKKNSSSQSFTTPMQAQKLKKSNSKNVRNQSNMSSTSDVGSTFTLPIHQGSVDGDFMGRPHHSILPGSDYQRKVTFPEAESLRKRKRLIEVKLDSLFQKKYMNILKKEIPEKKLSHGPYSTFHTEEKNNRRSGKAATKVSVNNPDSKVGKKDISWKQFSGLSCACKLPERRKTNWDYLLEEMRWLATDFIEERKWKTAASRTLSSSVLEIYRKKKTKRSPQKPIGRKKVTDATNEVDGNDRDNMEIEKNPCYYNRNAELDPDVLFSDRQRQKSYIDPSEEDVENAKYTTKMLNAMVEVHLESLISKESMNIQLMSTYRSCGGATLLSFEKDIYGNGDPQSRDAQSIKSPVDDKMTKKEAIDHQINQISDDRVDDCLRTLIEFISKEKISSDDSSERFQDLEGDISKKINLRLHQGQMEIIHTIESLWRKQSNLVSSPGVVLSGRNGCGKTVALGALMTRRIHAGPQLIISHPATVIRWRHELRRFSGLNVLTFGQHGWSYDKNSFINEQNISLSLNAGDVLICEVAAVEFLWGAKAPSSRKIPPFGTVAIDLRCHSSPSCDIVSAEKSTKNARYKIKGKLLSVDDQDADSSNIPSELRSIRWWNNVIMNLPSTKGKTMLIENSERVVAHSTLRSDFLAIKVAYLYHTLLKSITERNHSFGKRVFTLAKRLHLLSKEDKNIQKVFKFDTLDGSSKINKLRNILTVLHNTITYVLNGPRVTFPRWNIRLCSLQTSQREIYDKAVQYQRGALEQVNASFDKERFTGSNNHIESHLSAVKALIQLRRVCFHRDFFFNRLPTPCDSASQPNLDIAREFMEKSSKLRELFSILVQECGFQNDISLSLEKEYGLVHFDHNCSQRKKVLILATLPEIRFLTSTFLNSLGIVHRLTSRIPDHLAFDDCNVPTWKENGCRPSLMEVYWGLCQHAISQFINFSSNDTINSFNNTPLVLISSPACLGSYSLGLSITDVDIIVSLDEDWSGRGDFNLRSIFYKICTRYHNKIDAAPIFVKLIADETCEKNFLSENTLSSNSNDINPCIDADGNVLISREPFSGNASFASFYSDVSIGDSIFKFQDDYLATVFCTQKPIPPRHNDGEEPKFLQILPTEEKSSIILIDEESMNNIPPLVEETTADSKHSFSKELYRHSFVVALTTVEEAAKSGRFASLVPMNNHNRDSDMETKPTGSWGISSFSSSHISSRDLLSKKVQGYLCALQRITSGLGDTKQDCVAQISSEQNTGVDKFNLDPDISLLSGSSESSLSNVGSELAASSLLSYLPIHIIFDYLCLRKNDNGSVFSSGPSPLLNLYKKMDESGKKALNKFAFLYEQAQQIQDGNQGRESLIYFPPLLPGLLEAQCSFLQDRSLPLLPLGNVSQKRKESLQLSSHSSKKMRKINSTASLSAPSLGSSFELNATLLNPDFQPSDNLLIDSAMDTDFAFMSDPDLMASDSGLFDGEFLPPIESNATSFTTQNEVVDEDFSMLGSGLIPSLTTSRKFALRKSICANPHYLWADPFETVSSGENTLSNQEGYFSYLQNRLNSAILDSVILYVKVKQKSNDFSSSQFAGLPSYPYPLNQSAGFSNATYTKPVIVMATDAPDGSNDSIVKKMKRKSSDKRTSSGTLSLPVVASSDQMQNSFYGNYTAHSKNSSNTARSNPSKSRRSGSPFSLLTSGRLCGLPLINLQNRLLDIIEGYSCTPLLKRMEPNALSSIWFMGFSAIHDNTDDNNTLLYNMLQQNEKTGMSAIQISKSQLDFFLHSTTGPSYVDFGPFHLSYSYTPEKSEFLCRLPTFDGIQLPMGVKVPQMNKEKREPSAIPGFDGNFEAWSDHDDKQLKSIAEKFSYNWHMISRIMTRPTKTSTCNFRSRITDIETPHFVMRSARQCHERWDNITDYEPSSSKLVSPDTTNANIEIANLGDGSKFGSILFRNDVVSDVMDSTSPDGAVENECRPYLPYLKRSGAKRRRIALTVPGYNPSNSASVPTEVQSHPSHMQSVKAAVTSTAGANGIIPTRVDMWPLQYLDWSDQQKKRNTENSSRQRPTSSATASSAAASQSSQAPPNTNSHRNSNSSKAVYDPRSIPSKSIPPPHHQKSQSRQGMNPEAPVGSPQPMRGPVQGNPPMYGHGMYPNSSAGGPRKR